MDFYKILALKCKDAEIKIHGKIENRRTYRDVSDTLFYIEDYLMIKKAKECKEKDS